MTAQQERQLFNTLYSLKKEVGELKDMLKPYTPKRDELLTFRQVMEELSVKKTKLYEMLANGELPFAIKVGRQWRFSRNGIIDYLNRTR